jgi:hypothetical protein
VALTPTCLQRLFQQMQPTFLVVITSRYRNPLICWLLQRQILQPNTWCCKHNWYSKGQFLVVKQYQTKEDTDWAEMGPGRSAQAGRPILFRGPVGPPFDLVASQAIYIPLTESHASTNSSSADEEQRSLRDTISEMRVVLVV